MSGFSRFAILVFALAISVGGYTFLTKRTLAESSKIENVHSLFDNGEKKLRAGALDEAEKIFRRIIKEASPKTHAHQIFTAHIRLGDVMRRKGNQEKSGSKAATAKYQQAFQSYFDGAGFGAEQLKNPDAYKAGWIRDLVPLYIRMGDILVRMEKYEKSLRYYDSGAVLVGELIKKYPSDYNEKLKLAGILGKMGDQYKKLGRKDVAERYQRMIYQIMSRR